MEATEICLLWGDWQIQRWWSCMTKAEWSGWMQAIFSVLAILAAVLIAWGQHFLERRKSIRFELDAAFITALEVALLLKPISTRLKFFLDVEDLKANEDRKKYLLNCVLDDINAASSPSEDQLLRIMAIPGSCALDISRGFGLMKQVQHFLKFQTAPGIEMREGGIDVVYLRVVSDLKLSQTALEQGNEKLMNYVNLVYVPKKIASFKKQPGA